MEMPLSLETILPRTLAAAVSSVAREAWTVTIGQLENNFRFNAGLIRASCIVSLRWGYPLKYIPDGDDSGDPSLMLSGFRCLFVSCGNENARLVRRAPNCRCRRSIVGELAHDKRALMSFHICRKRQGHNQKYNQTHQTSTATTAQEQRNYHT